MRNIHKYFKNYIFAVFIAKLNQSISIKFNEWYEFFSFTSQFILVYFVHFCSIKKVYTIHNLLKNSIIFPKIWIISLQLVSFMLSQLKRNVSPTQKFDILDFIVSKSLYFFIITHNLNYKPNDKIINIKYPNSC